MPPPKLTVDIRPASDASIDDFLEGKPVSPEIADAIVARYQLTVHKRNPPIAPPR